MSRILRAIGAGVIATAVMMGVLLFVQVQTRAQLGAPTAIASYVGFPGRAYVGIVLFIAMGVFVWPVVFVIGHLVYESVVRFTSRFTHEELSDRLPDIDIAIHGMFFGGTLWVIFLLLSSGGPDWPFILLYLAFTLIAHLAYGYTLGLVYQWQRLA